MPRTRRAALVALATAVALGAGGWTALADKGGNGGGKRAATVVHTLDPSTHGNPEGVAWDKRSGTFFVGTVGDGTIYRGTLGAPTATVWLDGPGTSAVGMKAVRGKLYVAGGQSGELRVYDIATKALLGTFATGAGGFLNDLVVTGTGDVYVTDSFRPTLWKFTAAQVKAGTGAPLAIPLSPDIPYAGNGAFNLNGIVALDEGRKLVVVDSNTGTLYRIVPAKDGSANRTITVVKGATVKAGDGLLIDRGRLLAVTGDPAQIVVLKLKSSGRRAQQVKTVTDASLKGPSTVAVAKKRYLVVNADFSASTQPFTVSELGIRH